MIIFARGRESTSPSSHGPLGFAGKIKTSGPATRSSRSTQMHGPARPSIVDARLRRIACTSRREA
eukprot:6089443-Pyramimonas_sp.AAC.1